MEILAIAGFIFLGAIVFFSLIPPAENKNKIPLKEPGIDQALNNNAPKSVVARLAIRVAGVSHSNISGSTRQECIDKLSVIDKLWLERDENNPYDKNAIRVMSKLGQIGFIPRDHTAKISGANIENIETSLISKGRASNDLWGCTIEVLIPSHAQNPSPIKNEKTYTEVQLKDGRAFPHILLLQQLDSFAADIFDPDDDIKLTHASLGVGKIINIQRRDNAKALLTVMYATETCKHTSDIFSSPHISSTPMPVSMKELAISKYINILSSAKPYEKPKISDYYNSTYSDFSDEPFHGLSSIEISYIMDPEFDDKDTEYSDHDNGNDGIDSYWHEYNRHD